VSEINTMRRRLLCAGAALGACTAMPALAELQISIVGVGSNQLPIAVKTFFGSASAPVDLASVISADLERSGSFRMIPTGGETAAEDIHKPSSLTQWAQAGATALVVGSISQGAGGHWTARYALHDIVSGQEIDTMNYDVSADQLRMTAHRYADRIFTKLTGMGPMFASKLVYVAQLGKRSYQLVVSDCDGANPQIALQSPEPIISPTWSPDGRRIAYVSFERRKPIVYVQTLASGSRRAVAAFTGNNSAPAFSPDGRTMAVALSKDGLTAVYLINADGTGVRRFTQSFGIDTEPVFSKDGKYVYFTSDRGGSPQIYRKPVEGGAAQRVTFGSNYAISPDISPDGKLLAFISRTSGFRAAVMDLTSGQTTLVTHTQFDESPSFAPNGHFLVYATKEGGRGVLGTASADGRLATRLTGKGSIREPSWGPIIP
jgi:TolB protein